jgi:phosphoglycolate/pyridoxal phosphate phosphatase family enzyme
MVTDDPELIFRVAREVAAVLSEYTRSATPAHISEAGHGLTKRIVACDDPYRAVKDRYNAVALEMLPRLREIVAGSDDRLRTAAGIAVAGNVIDFALGHAIDVDAALRQVLEEGFAVDDWPAFRAALARARNIIYLGDNAGEVVFDRVFLEQLRREHPALEITYVVKPVPILNDATEADARAAGIHEICPIVTTGQPTVGFIFETLADEFRKRLEAADLIIAKGQANYESLDELDFPTMFILKAKCPTVAASLGVRPGQLVLKAHCLDERRSERRATPLRAVIFDLDGVIYRGKRLLPHAAEAVAWARERGLAVRFLTNNSTITRDDYSQRLEDFGIPTPPEQVMTSAYATALYLKSRGDGGAKVLVVGEGGLREEIARAGFEVVQSANADGARYVAVGMDRAFCYDMLCAAMHAILDGADFIASNRDTTFPIENGLLPGGGTVVAAIEAAVGRPPVLIGKPTTRMLELILAELGCEPAQVLIVGDRLDTDIKVGRAVGLRTALVLTGISTAEEAGAAPNEMRPEWVIESLAQLPALLERLTQ